MLFNEKRLQESRGYMLEDLWRLKGLIQNSKFRIDQKRAQKTFDQVLLDLKEVERFLEKGFFEPSDLVSVAQGDWGGQTYWVVDQDLVTAPEEEVLKTLEEVDKRSR